MAQPVIQCSAAFTSFEQGAADGGGCTAGTRNV